MGRIGFPQQSLPAVSGVTLTNEWHRYLHDLHQFSGLDAEKFPLYQDLVATMGDVIPDDVDGPDFMAISGGIKSWSFPSGETKSVHFSLQFPHGYLPDTRITPFVQWSPSDDTSGDVRWALEYIWAGVDVDFDTSAAMTITGTSASSQKPGRQQSMEFAIGTPPNTVNYIDPRVPGTNPKDKTVSSVFMGRLYRDGGNANDTYLGDALFFSVGLHYWNAAHGTVTTWPG